jgi:hypothetical protein
MPWRPAGVQRQMGFGHAGLMAAVDDQADTSSNDGVMRGDRRRQLVAQDVD